MVTVIQRLVDLTTNRIIGILLPNAGASTEAPSKDLHRLLYGSIPESLQNDVWLYGLNGSVGNVLLDTNRIGMVTRLLRQDHRPTRGSDLFRIAVFSGAALKRESTFSNQALACSQPLPCEIRSNAYSVGTSDYEDAEIAILRSDHVVFRPILRHDPLGITIAYPADAETTIQSSLHDFERTISNPLRSWARDNLDTYLTSLQVRQHGLREVDDNLLPLDDELGEDR